MIVLSILIPTLPDRHNLFFSLLGSLLAQVELLGARKSVEILFDQRGREVTTGEKRNDLISRARGKYVWHVDDDDEIYDYAIEEILNAATTNCDCIAINGIYSEKNTGMAVEWYISIKNPYISSIREHDKKEIYLRFPNHITPMKLKLIKNIPFPHIYNGEDYEWACAVKKAEVLKTETVIEKPIYHYRK